MVSLSKFTKITEEGALFASPFTGEPTLLTPEESMLIQHTIAADIIMQLDDVGRSSLSIINDTTDNSVDIQFLVLLRVRE